MEKKKKEKMKRIFVHQCVYLTVQLIEESAKFLLLRVHLLLRHAVEQIVQEVGDGLWMETHRRKTGSRIKFHLPPRQSGQPFVHSYSFFFL